MKNSVGFYFVLLIIGVCFISCQKKNEEITGLKGTWIGTYDNNDTIVFNSSSTSGLFILKRGYESRNGSLVPKLGTGLYSYEISNDNINVVSVASSSGTGIDVYFKLSESEKNFQVGIFTTGFVTNLAIVEYKKIE